MEVCHDHVTCHLIDPREKAHHVIDPREKARHVTDPGEKTVTTITTAFRMQSGPLGDQVGASPG
jgi:hypothetical protein